MSRLSESARRGPLSLSLSPTGFDSRSLPSLLLAPTTLFCIRWPSILFVELLGGAATLPSEHSVLAEVALYFLSYVVVVFDRSADAFNISLFPMFAGQPLMSPR